MEEFIKQFGIDWRLLLSQVVNFLIVLVALRAFVYKPVAKMLRDRQARIEEGLSKAAEADTRIEEAQQLLKQKRKEAEEEALRVLREMEAKTHAREVELLAAVKKKEEEALHQTQMAIEGEKQKAEKELLLEAHTLLREALIRTTELDPKHIDEALIKKALQEIA